MQLHNPHQPSIAIEAQATYYPHMVSVYIPKNPFYKLPETDSNGKASGFYSDEDHEFISSSETNQERSIRRTQKRISDYVLCNLFELFVTFTFGEDRQNIDKKRQQMSDWLRNQRKRNGKFDYLIIPELHKDGESLHFHALFYGYLGLIEKAINPKTGELITQNKRPVYVLPEYTLGFTNAKAISSSAADQTRVACYIKKYITKDMPTFKNRQRYWASKNLRLPKIEYNPEKWYEVVKPDWEMETENGRILRFNAGSHPLIDIYLEAHR